MTFLSGGRGVVQTRKTDKHAGHNLATGARFHLLGGITVLPKQGTSTEKFHLRRKMAVINQVSAVRAGKSEFMTVGASQATRGRSYSMYAERQLIPPE